VILLALALIGFGIADLVRWSPDPVSARRSWLALAVGLGATVALAALGGLEALDVAVTAAVMLVALGVWLTFDRPAFEDLGPGYPLAWVLAVVAACFAASGSVDAVGGYVEEWYEGLPFGFAGAVAVDQFLLGLGAALFVLATSNRIVRLVLTAAGVPAEAPEKRVPGGRLIGPMERVIVSAMVLAGDPAGAALVIAAKGLVRLPEIRSEAERREGTSDHVAEYLLIGTFMSLLLSAGLAVLVLGAG
jgi:hypothetical protein